jgi:hypothetical protein
LLSKRDLYQQGFFGDIMRLSPGYILLTLLHVFLCAGMSSPRAAASGSRAPRWR